MSVLHSYTVRCGCGQEFTASLAKSVNVTRVPRYREEILAGTFHRVQCPHCKRQMTVEKAFSYADFGRNTFFRVQPRQERHQWRQASVALEAGLARLPRALAARESRAERVVFGLSELREKLVAQDAQLDDRVVELLKVLVVSDHPFLLQRPRLRLALTAVDAEGLEFIASYDLGKEAFRVRLPRAQADSFLAEPEQARAWSARSHPRASLFELDGDYWVNMWRWSPQPDALAGLAEAARKVRAGEPLDLSEPAFLAMLDRLPHGNSLPGWAKRDLQDLFNHVRAQGDDRLQDRLFEIRFGIALDDDWALNDDPEDIATLWKLLHNLPDSNVEGNVFIDEILLEPGAGGGWYEPWAHDIYIETGALSDPESFEDLIRHEVGHGVHELYRGDIDAMLERDFGWRSFPADNDGVDGWVELMGGWGDLTAAQRRQVRGWLIEALGPGSSWEPGPAPPAPARHPWHRPDFGPRLAYERSMANWYRHHATWYRRGDRAFYMNFWYRTFVSAHTTALDLVARMPSSYAAMSHFEFFAELYALYYDLDDPKRPAIPAATVQWLDEHIGAPAAGARHVASLRPAHRSGGRRIRRPSAPVVRRGRGRRTA